MVRGADEEPAGVHVAYTRDALTIDGKPFFCISGSVHYPRSHPSVWPQLFWSMRRDGLNTVETYVFWNEHESCLPRDLGGKGSPDFTGPLDLVRFIRCAALHNLYVILRIGPYVCAEVNYGGFPWWLRDLPGKMVEGDASQNDGARIRFRTWNTMFCEQIERWLHVLIDDHLRPANVFAPQGGPVILVQLENEYAMVSERYGSEGNKYMDWVVALQNRFDTGVPLIMCYGTSKSRPSAAIETINAFYAHELVDSYRAARAGMEQPLMWTECWTGWYDVWGAPHHERDAQDIAYAVLRFWATGGSAVNYYVYFGGTNTRRQSTMYLQTTSYDYDAPLNEYLMETTKSRHLRRMHQSIAPFIDESRGILDMSRVSVEISESERRAILYEWVPGRGLNGNAKRMVFDSADVCDQVRLELVPIFKDDYRADLVAKWQCRVRIEEPVFQSTGRNEYVCGDLPDIISATRDSSDYAWYRMYCENANGHGVLRIQVSDFCQVWRQLRSSPSDARPSKIDMTAEWIASGPEPAYEDRFRNDWNEIDYGYPTIDIDHVTSEFEYIILVSSLGMVKGDWQLPPGKNMADERKGLLSAQYTTSSDRLLWHQATLNGFCAGLDGERNQSVICGDANVFPSIWTPVTASQRPWPCWYRLSIAFPPQKAGDGDGILMDCGDAQLEKGWIYVNGSPCGRHWSIGGVAPKNGFLLKTGATGQIAPVEQVCVNKPTQSIFYIPEWMLNTTTQENHIAIFDEHSSRRGGGFDPRRLRFCRPMNTVSPAAP